jgi:AcrR family transcriptional regulator
MATTAAEIASAIQARIAAGQLRPGDRVPSARQITRDWGVAIATATKALAALQADGLVRSVVGVGTVVAPRPQQKQPKAERPQPKAERSQPKAERPQPKAERTQPKTERPQRTVWPSVRGAELELSRPRIIRTAIALADAEGLAAVTMRRLAAELDVAVMSLYRHVAGKEELVLLMADQVFAEVPVPVLPATAGWRERLETLVRAEWSVAKRHPWTSSAMSSLARPLMVPHGMDYTDAIMRVLRELGLDPVAALQVTVAIAGLIVGVGASLQMEADAQRVTGITSDEWMAQQEPVMDALDVPGRFPMIAEVAALPGFDLILDDVFEAGLALLLDGLARRLTTANPTGAKRTIKDT